MSVYRVALTVCVPAIAIGAAFLISTQRFKEAVDVLLVLFGILSGFLIQAMLMTASALQDSGLGSKDVHEFAGRLDRQQAAWRSLFFLYIATILVLVFGKFIPAKILVPLSAGWSLDLTRFWVALCVFVGAVAILRSLYIPRGISALQKLRAHLLEDQASEREKAARTDAARDAEFRPGALKSGYGRTVEFPHPDSR